MGGPPRTQNGDKKTMKKGRGKETTSTTDEPLPMLILQTKKKQTRGKTEV